MSATEKGIFAAPFKICADNHSEVAYQGSDCPVCEIRLQLDQVLDAKTDIEEADIFDLYGQQTIVNKRLRRIEKKLGLEPIKKHWWSSNKVSPTVLEQSLPKANF